MEQRSKEDLKYWDIWVQSQDLSTDGKGVGQGQEEGVCVCMCVLGKRLVPLLSPSRGWEKLNRSMVIKTEAEEAREEK